MAPEPKRVAAVVTEYRKWSHADVIVGKILDGYHHDGKTKPNLKLVSLYTDQVPKNDMSRDLAKKHGFKIYPSISECLTLGGKKLAVDGVLIIGEHGMYPDNEIGQKLYPRRKFFEEVVNTFEACGSVCPILNDKHLAAVWDDAKWMYDTAAKKMIPFMAGSTIPLTWRKPDYQLSLKSNIVSAIQLGYGPFEGYGFHAIEGLQCMLERRAGGETGVAAVTCLQGQAMFDALDKLPNSKAILQSAIEIVPAHAKGDYRSICIKDKQAGVFLIEYRDGLTAAVAMLNGFLYEGDGGAFIFSGMLKDDDTPKATQFYLQQPDPFGHFAYFVKGFESMLNTQHAPYPVERTLLTTGILDAVMRSKHAGGKRIETPHLKIIYQPSKWMHAQDPIPKPQPKK